MSIKQINLLIVVCILALGTYVAFLFFGSERETTSSTMTTEPRVVQSYTITRGDGPTVIVEVWEMEYQGRTLQTMRFDDTSIKNQLAKIRFEMSEMNKDIYERIINQYSTPHLTEEVHEPED